MKSELIIRIDKDAQSGDVYTLVRAFSRCGVTVPAGFRSDGASVPRFFWRAVFPPGDVHALSGAFLHDFVYRTHPAGWTRKEADRVFFEILTADGVPWRRACLAWLGVRLFGAPAWRAGGEKK